MGSLARQEDFQAAARKATKNLGSQLWRLNNLYHVESKKGQVVPFVMNEAQRSLYRNMHYLNMILKARQLGFSTFIAIFFLDVCVFNPSTQAGIIDLTIDDAKKKLQKAKLAYDMVPRFGQPEDERHWLHDWCPLVTSSAYELKWGNGSALDVGTSHRGGTKQYLHISELGPIAAKSPEKAKEIRTGALNAIHRVDGGRPRG
jgi:hypothetical protein